MSAAHDTFTPARSLVARSALAGALALAAVPAFAQGVPMDDKALSDTWGQALLDLTNTSQNGYDFSRLTLNADITLQATLSGLKLGTKNGASDIDISSLSFGSASDQSTVAITDPYFEWVYTGTGANRQVVGMRIGFGGIAGNVGLVMNSVSGSLAINTGSTVATLNGSQQTTFNCGTGCTAPLNSVTGVTAGDANGASRDFFLSILKTALVYPTTDPSLGAPATSQAGFWLNWTDRLKAIGATAGAIPATMPKIGP